jgi:hypothetical protein
MLVSGLAVLLALVPAASAFASTVSTTGASGRFTTPSSSDPDRCATVICLWATDTLTDGHCARWQHEVNGVWGWYGRASCSGSEELIATNAPDGVYRLCRTGVENCTYWIWIAFN